MMLAELMQQAGLPAGVINIVTRKATATRDGLVAVGAAGLAPSPRR
mgnify:CR=1 FL=1